jgi:uncharacterized protein YdhG (YjbR/CyaY superfamily)
MNMFKSSDAQSVQDYLDAVPEERKDTINTLHTFIQKAVPELKVYFASNMIGYGSFPYRNYKKQLINWPTVALANQKNYVSIYVCSVDAGGYIAEQHKDRLGKVSVGKSCIRFKKLADINLDELKKVLQLAAKNPGLGTEV